MEFSNTEKWLLVLKEGDATFEDIRKTIDEIQNAEFDYETKEDKHAVFHMILNDLDTLCQSGDAIRAFEKVNESEVSEIYRITPKGLEKAEKLLKDQGHQK
jgi:DNA-binding PadR family transcriptional regulator